MSEPAVVDFQHAHWFALYVAPRQESHVASALGAKGFQNCAAIYAIRRRWSDRMKTQIVPLFPGYVFCRFTLDGRGSVLKTVGVRSVISFGGQPAPVDDGEVERIQRATASELPLEPLAGVRTGDRVRIIDGPLRGVEGVLTQAGGRARVVLGVSLLQRSVAVEIGRDMVEAIDPVKFTKFADLQSISS